MEQSNALLTECRRTLLNLTYTMDLSTSFEDASILEQEVLKSHCVVAAPKYLSTENSEGDGKVGGWRWRWRWSPG